MLHLMIKSGAAYASAFQSNREEDSTLRQKQIQPLKHCGFSNFR
jgi:hypothetical protein